MRAMEGVRYVTDESGKRVAVQLDLEIFGEVWEDLEDALVLEARKHEARIPLEEARRQLVVTAQDVCL